MEIEFDAYPNRGEAYIPNFAKERDDRSREKEDVEAYKELYAQIIDRLNIAIDQLGSIDSVEPRFTLNRNKFMNTVRANKIAKNFLTNERDNLQAIINQHLK